MKRNALQLFTKWPWAIMPEKFAEIEAFLQRRQAEALPLPYQPVITIPTTEEQKQVLRESWAKSQIGAERTPIIVRRGDEDGVAMAGRIALLPLFGVICQRMNLMTEISGGTSTELYGRAIDRLVADREVKSIVMVVDSPGGNVFGVQELAQKIYDARGKKKIVAIADSMAASAAYWIGSQASELVVTPSGTVGSVGVIAAHVDESKAEEEAGFKTTLITAGKYKSEGHPSQPLTDEAVSYLQSQVDAYYASFVADVARGRGMTENRVQKDFGQGRMALAKEAVSRGMADRVSTLEQVISRLGGGSGASASAAAARARAVEIGD